MAICSVISSDRVTNSSCRQALLVDRQSCPMKDDISDIAAMSQLLGKLLGNINRLRPKICKCREQVSKYWNFPLKSKVLSKFPNFVEAHCQINGVPIYLTTFTIFEILMNLKTLHFLAYWHQFLWTQEKTLKKCEEQVCIKIQLKLMPDQAFWDMCSTSQTSLKPRQPQ